MPRYADEVRTVADCYRLDLPRLRRLGLLQPGSSAHRWRQGALTGIISFEPRPEIDATYLHLRYTLGDCWRSQWIELVTVPSNLPGRLGHHYLMCCPTSGRRATVLLLSNGAAEFRHRLACGERLYYSSQLHTPGWRWAARLFADDERWANAWRKGRKKWYLGKPTRWYASLLRGRTK